MVKEPVINAWLAIIAAAVAKITPEDHPFFHNSKERVYYRKSRFVIIGQKPCSLPKIVKNKQF
jgi:hypothetical protein